LGTTHRRCGHVAAADAADVRPTTASARVAAQRSQAALADKPCAGLGGTAPGGFLGRASGALGRGAGVRPVSVAPH